MPQKAKSMYQGMLKDPVYFGSTIFRIAFGILFILVAIKKFRMGYGGFADSLVTADSLMAKEIPHFLLYIYGYILPALELVIGIALLFNKYAQQAYITAAAVYLSFVFGQMYNLNTSKIGTEYLPSLIAIAIGYYFNHEWELKRLKS